MLDEYDIFVWIFQENWSRLEIELTREPPAFGKWNNPAGKKYIFASRKCVKDRINLRLRNDFVAFFRSEVCKSFLNCW